MKWIFAFVLAGLLCGCASSQNPPPNQERVSSIPWNRPEKWEGTGALGGMTPSSQ